MLLLRTEDKNDSLLLHNTVVILCLSHLGNGIIATSFVSENAVIDRFLLGWFVVELPMSCGHLIELVELEVEYPITDCPTHHNR